MTENKTIKVNPDLLIWARVNEGMSIQEAAIRLDIGMDYLFKLERNEVSPTLDILKNMATVYRRPLAAFLLPQPPIQNRRFVTGIKFLYNDGSEEEHIFKEDDL